MFSWCCDSREKNTESLPPSREDLQQQSSEAQDLIRQLEHRLRDAETDNSRLTERSSTAIATISRLESERNELQAHNSAGQRQLSEAQDLIRQLEHRLRDAETDNSRLTERSSTAIATISRLESERNELQAHNSAGQRQLGEARSEITSLQQNLQSAKVDSRQSKELQLKVESLQKDSLKNVQHIKQLEEDRAQLQAKIRTDTERAYVIKQEMQEKISSLKIQIEEYSDTILRKVGLLQSERHQTTVLQQDLTEKMLELQDAQVLIARFEERIKSYSKKLSENQKEINELTYKIKELREENESLQELNSELQSVIKKAAYEGLTLAENNDELKEKLMKAAQALEDCLKEKDGLAKLLSYHIEKQAEQNKEREREKEKQRSEEEEEEQQVQEACKDSLNSCLAKSAMNQLVTESIIQLHLMEFAGCQQTMPTKFVMHNNYDTSYIYDNIVSPSSAMVDDFMQTMDMEIMGGSFI